MLAERGVVGLVTILFLDAGFSAIRNFSLFFFVVFGCAGLHTYTVMLGWRFDGGLVFI